MEVGEKVETIGVKKGAGTKFLSQFPATLPPHIDGISLHFNGALEVDSFGSILEVHTFIYIYTYTYSGIIYAFGQLIYCFQMVGREMSRVIHDFLSRRGLDVRGLDEGLCQIVINMIQSL